MSKTTRAGTKMTPEEERSLKRQTLIIIVACFILLAIGLFVLGIVAATAQLYLNHNE